MAAVLRRQMLPALRVLRPFCHSLGYRRYVAADTKDLGDGDVPLTGGFDQEEMDFVKDFKLYEGHIPTSCLQKTLLAVGSAVTALYDPTRHDMVAVLGETTGHFALRRMYERMRHDPDGREILRLRPRISSKTINLDELRKLPDETLGREYVRFLDTNEISPDTRAPVRFVDDTSLAYVMQRYREIHDFAHVLTGFPNISVASEVAVKWFELIQTGLPMCGLSAVMGPLGFHNVSSQERSQLRRQLIPWAVTAGLKSANYMNVFYERHLDEPLETLRQRMNLPQAPSFL